MIEREIFEAWARQRWTHPEDFDQRIKAPSKYNNYEVQAAWEAWQERSAQPAPSVPDVDALAQFIREIDGDNRLGTGALAERIVEWLAVAPEDKS